MGLTVRRVAVLVTLLSLPARAGAEEAPRWKASLELAGLFSPAGDGERRDVGGWVAFVPRYRLHVRRDLALTAGLSIPLPPLIALHVPLGVEWTPGSPRNGLVVSAGVRPLWGRVDLCGASGTCPLNDAADPYDRGGTIFGVAAHAGAGYRFPIRGWSFEVSAAAAAGSFDGGARNAEEALDGVYRGFVIELGLLR